MQYKLDQTAFEALSESLQKEYVKGTDGTYLLNIEGEGAPTAEAIEKAEEKRRIEEVHRKEAERKLEEADKRALKLQQDLENAGGNKEEIAKIKEDHQKEIERLREERESDKLKFKQERDQGLIREAASKFANDKFTIPSLVTDQIAKRLTVEEIDGEPVLRVLTPEGKPSTHSLSDLQKEFLDNKEFSSIIKANVGSGGGALPNKGGGAPNTKSFKEMNATEQALFAKNDPEGYAAAVKESDS